MAVIFKRTKILATIGPSTHSEETIAKLIESGANGFRLNCSHGTNDERKQVIEWVRSASAKVGKPVAILLDLQGPKIRLGELDQNTPVKAGDELVLAFGAKHDGLTIPVQYNLAEKVKPGELLYIFDGKIKTVVSEIVDNNSIKVEVKNPGVLMSKKGINLPDTDFSGDILTPKDIADLEFGATQDIDFVALSFVQSGDDIRNLRKRMQQLGSDAHIVAKIETKASLKSDHLEDIVMASDGVMIARGDLAVEVGPEVVPVAQRRIVALCRQHAKLSIVATQMMASMVDSPEPTRAEVGDVATAVIIGSDAVMLSEETAMGKYPIETVKAMKNVILYTQQHSPVDPLPTNVRSENVKSDAISTAAVALAEELEVDAIVAETKSGATAANVAAHRPNLPIISVTSVPRAAQQLALWYANKSFLRPDSMEAGSNLAKELKKSGFFGTDESVCVAIISGRQPGVIGATDTIRFEAIK